MSRRVLAALAALALAVWAFFPVILLVVHASASHAQWTGADGLIGADGVLGADQLQYLAWARSVAGHGLASDLFTLRSSGYVYLEPVSGAVGGLLALGLPLITGYLLAKALAVLGLAAAAALWVRRLLPGSPRAQLAGLTLALFTVTPATAIVNWAQTGSARFRFDVYLAGDELLAATKLWGYVPAALAIALLAGSLLALERALASERPDLGGGARRRPRRLALPTAAVAALLAAWLHPWQGITLELILVALAIVRRRRGELPAFALVAGAALLPLVYYAVLAHADPLWRMAAANESGPRLPALVLLICVGPLIVLGALGVRRPGPTLAEQALLIWVPAALVTYFANDAFSTHALQGVSFPFAVLAVRGATRVRLAPVAGGLCVALLTVPGLAYDARKFVRTADSPLVQYALPDSDAAALRWVAAHAPAGGVLAPTPLATVIPSQTGRAVWVGHGDWSPHYRRRAREVDRLFAGRLPARRARAFIAATGARVLVADCAHPAALAAGLGLGAPRRFGCARVWVLNGPTSQRVRATTAAMIRDS
jgi:hypothetical protein